MIAPPALGSGLPPRGPLASGRKPALPPLQPGLLVGSSFGFSMSDSDSRRSAASSESSDFPVAGVRRKLGSKSSNGLEESDQYTPLSNNGMTTPGLRSSMSFHGLSDSIEDSTGGESAPILAERTSRPVATGILSSSPSSSITERGGSITSQSPAGIALRYDRTATVGYNRLLARFMKGPSPRAMNPMGVRGKLEGRAIDGSYTFPSISAGTAPSGDQQSTRAPVIPDRGYGGRGSRRIGGIASRGGRGRGRSSRGRGRARGGVRSGKLRRYTRKKFEASHSDPNNNNNNNDDGNDNGSGSGRSWGDGVSPGIASQTSDGSVNETANLSGNGSVPLKPPGSRRPGAAHLGTMMLTATQNTFSNENGEEFVKDGRGDAVHEESRERPRITETTVMVVSPGDHCKSESSLESTGHFSFSSTPVNLFRSSSLHFEGHGIGGRVSIGISGGRGLRFAGAPSLSISSTSNSEGGWRTRTPHSSSNPFSAGTAESSSNAMVTVTPVGHTSEALTSVAPTTPRSREIVATRDGSDADTSRGHVGSVLHETAALGPQQEQEQEQEQRQHPCHYHARFASAARSSSPGVVIQVRGCGRSGSSVGGGSAAEAPPASSSSSVPVILSEGGTLGAGGAGFAGGGRRRKTNHEYLRERETRIAHLEAAMVRSEVELCRAKTELEMTRQEMCEMRRAQEAQDRFKPSPENVSTLYHALEGSVVLLQIASEKMLQLERCLNKYRTVVPEHVFKELQKCVSQDTFIASPLSAKME